MLGTSSQILVILGPRVMSSSSVTGGSYKKNVFFLRAASWSGRCPGGSGWPGTELLHLCGPQRFTPNLGSTGA